MTIQERNDSIIPRERWFWAGLALLLILAGWLYLRGYNASLPFIVHHDEPQHVIAAQHIIDFGHESGVHDQYPPGTKTLAYLLLKHIKPVDAHHGMMLPALRLITISAWMLAIVLIAMLGRLILNPLTGLFGAAIWIVNPWVVERARWLLPDGYLTLFTLLAIWLALVGALHWRRSLSSAAVYSIMLATLFKTQALFVAPLIVFLPLYRLFVTSDATDAALRKEALEQVAWNCVRLCLFLFWLLFITPALEMDRIVYFTMSFESMTLPSFESAWASLRNVLQTFQQADHWLPSAALGLLLLRYRRRVNGLALSVIVLAALAWLAGMSMFNVQDRRHFFAVGAIVSLLYAFGLMGLLYALQEAFADLQKPALTPRVRRLLVSGAFLVVLVLSLLPKYHQSDNLAHYFTLRDRRNDLMEYMDTSLEPGKFVTNRVEDRTISHRGWSGYLTGDREWGNHKTFNRAWGGYDGVHDFPVSQTVFDLQEKPLDVWRANNAQYAIMPHWRMLDDPDIYFPDETVLLKTYPASDKYAGPDMVVLRLYPMQNTVTGQLGGIHLKGYDISATTAQAGDDIILRHYWQAESAPETALHVFNHLLDENGQIAAQVDGIPLYDSRRDTTSQDDPDEILLGRNFILRLPTDLPPGEYRLISGFYDPQTFARLASVDGADYLPITEITIIASQSQ